MVFINNDGSHFIEPSYSMNYYLTKNGMICLVTIQILFFFYIAIKYFTACKKVQKYLFFQNQIPKIFVILPPNTSCSEIQIFGLLKQGAERQFSGS